MSEDAIKQVIGLVTTYGMNVIGGVIILILGWMVAKWASRITSRLMGRSGNVDKTLQSFLSSLVKYAILAFVLIAVLNQFGVQTASLIAVFGAAGLAIGLALQGTLSNIAAGTMLLIFRPIKVDQVVEIAGKTGKVVSVSLFTTELATPDNIQIIIPNAAVWGSTVVNLSHHPTRRVDFVLGIGYDDDIDKAMEVVKGIIEGDDRIHKDPAPQIVVGNLGDNSVDLTIRVWADASNYWPIKFDLTKAFKEACDANGLSIPYPQRDVHIHQAG
ncbi:MAG TPA: mechanosensitive ion channel protein MscS [Rhodospirillaceae bacterium]|nr:mechanosensitive ion channel protein MscS [Rhodospirillaceae bacterium]HAA90910.1 mechanosensitive ion channel protein MscS [Rhodospirillaceae bacterium]HAT34368.1 mechanosensitive ion channel protein MscS [Rhodospirillaceae bacterium]